MAMYAKDKTVFDESLDRIRFIYDNCDEVVVNMSGGKDSTVVFNLALIVAKERGALPLKVFWLDQEAEWQHTVDYMDGIMRRPEVDPLWFQIPFDFTNSLSTQKNFLRSWDPEKEELWVHPKSDISIKDNPTDSSRFHVLMDTLVSTVVDSDDIAVLTGMRAEESLARRFSVSGKKAQFKGINWCGSKKNNRRNFWPIWDWKFQDVWTAIARNGWDYNGIYDLQYIKGLPTNKMRVSALIHETAWRSIGDLQEFEPETYNRFCRRVAGTNAMSHTLDYGELMPKELPFAFRDWKEYRDYLLENIVKPEYRELFRHRWAKQFGDDWYKIHVQECIINDIDGTLNKNRATTLASRKSHEPTHRISISNRRELEEFKKREEKASD